MSNVPDVHPLAYLPSPTVAELSLGPFPIRFYALCIIVGIGVAVWLGERRWRGEAGGDGEENGGAGFDHRVVLKRFEAVG